jgi:repressor LexA
MFILSCKITLPPHLQRMSYGENVKLRDGEYTVMIGELLIDLRKDIGMTQRELSEKLFINYRTYSGYERNEIEASDDIKIKLAQFYNVSVDYLLGISRNPCPIKKGDEYVRIPKALSDSGRKELEQYISYLIAKEKKR